MTKRKAWGWWGIAWLLTGAGVALAEGPRVTGSVGRFVGGSTTGWEGSLLVDPIGPPSDEQLAAARKAPDDGGCGRVSWNFGATQGVEITQALAHYTEGEVAVALTDDCMGVGIPLAGLTVSAGERRRGGGAYAGQQYTVAFFTLPWPFLQFYGRRVVHDESKKAQLTEAGLMFKIPIPVYGYHWPADSEIVSP
jgi:hypothetical protein